jgi:DNA-binding NarL/FixJ family response regulator
MIDLIVADDRAVCREGLKRILADHPDLRIAAEAASGEQLTALISEISAQVIVMEVSLPGRGLSDLVRSIRRRRGSPRILLVGASPGHKGALAALRSGAAGAVARDEPSAVLAEAIHRVASGGRFVSRSLTRRAPPPIEGLSEREFEVLRLFGSGRNGREISEELGLSPKTVSTYRARLLKKLGLRNLSDLVRFALDRGLAY